MSLEEFIMKRVRRQFTVEFKKNAVSLQSAWLLMRKEASAKWPKVSIFHRKR